jgi:hypothetical protein
MQNKRRTQFMGTDLDTRYLNSMKTNYHENFALRKARSLLAFLIFNASNKPTFRNRA